MEKLSFIQDKELVELFKEGSKQAFEALYLRYIKKVTLFCKCLLRDEIRAEDISHDVFLQILENPDSLNPDKSFIGYLQTIARNLILNEFCRTDIHLRYAQHIIKHENDSANETEDMILDNDYAKLLKEMIDSLTPQQKEVFRLSRIQGLDYNEIAKLMKISVPTVQFHASLALKTIKKYLIQHAGLHFKTVITFLLFYCNFLPIDHPC